MTTKLILINCLKVCRLLEFDKRFLIFLYCFLKSGPNWGNSSQIAKMKDNFQKAKKILRSNQSKINIVAVNGCCYGQDKKPDKGASYLKLCGQSFLEIELIDWLQILQKSRI